LPYGLKS
jgi:hypothetical protein